MRERKPHRHHVLRGASQVGRPEIVITFQQQPCAGQQHNRKSDFRGEECPAQPNTTVSGAGDAR